MNDGKRMHMAFADGTYVHFEWRQEITLEQLEMLEEVVVLQLASIRRAIERKKAEAQESAAGSNNGEKP